MWIVPCLIRWYFNVKALLKRLHLYSFSPVCTHWWYTRRLLHLKFFMQNFALKWFHLSLFKACLCWPYLLFNNGWPRYHWEISCDIIWINLRVFKNMIISQFYFNRVLLDLSFWVMYIKCWSHLLLDLHYSILVDVISGLIFLTISVENYLLLEKIISCLTST